MEIDSIQTNSLEVDGNIASGGVNDNLLINGNFDIWQRGTSASAAVNLFVADRWTNSGTTNYTVSRQSFSPGQTDVPNEPTYYLRITPSSSTTIGLNQKIEDVRTLAGKTVTVSFWAKSSSNVTLSTNRLRQNFGSGGSTEVTNIGLTSFNLTTTWQQFTLTTNLPSVSGKTIGSSSYLMLEICRNVTNITIDVAQVKVEEGSVATPFLPRSFGEELTLCQRYFQKTYNYDVDPGTASLTGSLYCRDNGGAGSSIYASSFRFSPPMRVNPTVVTYDGAGTAGKISSGGTNGYNSNVSVMWWGFRYWGCASSPGLYLAMQFTADAEI